MKRGIHMNEEFEQILRSLQYAKKYIFNCFNYTQNVLENTSESDALTDSEKNEIRKITGLPIWKGWTLTMNEFGKKFYSMMDKKVNEGYVCLSFVFFGIERKNWIGVFLASVFLILHFVHFAVKFL